LSLSPKNELEEEVKQAAPKQSAKTAKTYSKENPSPFFSFKTKLLARG